MKRWLLLGVLAMLTGCVAEYPADDRGEHEHGWHHDYDEHHWRHDDDDEEHHHDDRDGRY